MGDSHTLQIPELGQFGGSSSGGTLVGTGQGSLPEHGTAKSKPHATEVTQPGGNW